LELETTLANFDIIHLLEFVCFKPVTLLPYILQVQLPVVAPVADAFAAVTPRSTLVQPGEVSGLGVGVVNPANAVRVRLQCIIF
jgi:hypothetical protein